MFALIHVHHVSDLGAIRLLSELAIVSAGGVLFAWLFVQWNDNLWVPIGAHAAMNLWWEVFDVDSTAIGTRAGNFARLLFVAVVVTMTVRRTTHTNGSRVP